jgi:hypothetical protein
VAGHSAVQEDGKNLRRYDLTGALTKPLVEHFPFRLTCTPNAEVCRTFRTRDFIEASGYGLNRSENLFDVSPERLAIHRTFEHERRGQTIMAQRSDKRGALPVAVQHPLYQPLAAWGAGGQLLATLVSSIRDVLDQASIGAFARHYAGRLRPVDPARRRAVFF